MLERVLHFSIEHRWLLVLLTIALAGLGVYNLQRLPIDAVPDITNKQVQINTLFPALSPIEIEKRSPFPSRRCWPGSLASSIRGRCLVTAFRR
jgi:cobalt-zinc-cadmium resistance protein CzcA